MKLRAFLIMAAVGLSAGSLVAEASAAPQPVVFAKKKAKGKKAQAAGPKGKLKKTIQIAPRGLRWGMSPTAVAKLYDKVFEKEFLPLYKKVQPGPRMKALDAELENKKGLLRRNVVQFGNTPFAGYDNSPLKGEFSYGNGESMTWVTLRSGTKRHFFFFNDKLWKVYDEHKLRKGGPLGDSFNDAVKILTKKLKTAPVMVEADYAKGRAFEEAHWHDGSTYIRALNREYQNILAMVYADESIQRNLSRHRTNKLKDPHAMDKEVEAVMGGGKDEIKGDDKKKKKK